MILLGSQYISSYIIDCIFAGIHFCFTGYFCAYGKSYIGFIHNILSILLLRIPGSYLASKMYPHNLFPMGFAAPAGSILSIVICGSVYLDAEINAWRAKCDVIKYHNFDIDIPVYEAYNSMKHTGKGDL